MVKLRFIFPVLYASLAFAIFVFKLPLVEILAYLSHPIDYLVSQVFKLSEHGQSSSFGPTRTFWESPYFHKPIEVPSQHFDLMLLLTLSLLLWYLIGLFADKIIHSIKRLN